MVAPGSEGRCGCVSYAHPSHLAAEPINGLLHDSPIYDGDFADPYVLATPTGFTVYATSTAPSGTYAGAHIPSIVLPRNSGFSGSYVGDVLPNVPAWTTPGSQWAPSVWARPDGTYVLYYSTPSSHLDACPSQSRAATCIPNAQTGWAPAMCISRATSTTPTGPFIYDSSSAFICPAAQGGAIDPSVFVSDSGAPWPLGKSDGNCCNQPTSIFTQPLAPDGLSVAGPAQPLIGATQAWEGGLVEGPSMIQGGSTFWLFYSANKWDYPSYSIGIARCMSISGPCTKPLDKAWTASSTTPRPTKAQEARSSSRPGRWSGWCTTHSLPAKPATRRTASSTWTCSPFPREACLKLRQTCRPRPWHRSPSTTKIPRCRQTLDANHIDPLEAYTAMIAGAVYFCPAQTSRSLQWINPALGS